MTQDHELLVKQLIYRSWHRGCKETDILLEDFARNCLKDMTYEQVKCYESFLQENDWDIYEWLVGKKPLPDHHNNSVIQLLKQFINQQKNEKY